MVNEDPTEKLIRELKEENEKLMNMLKAAQAGEVVTMKSEDDDDDDDDDENSKKMSEEGMYTKNVEEILFIIKRKRNYLNALLVSTKAVSQRYKSRLAASC